jgi:hypothetical protein
LNVFQSVLAFLSALRVFFRSRSDIALEVLALRQQVAVLKRRRPRPILNRLDRLFWTGLCRVWRRSAEALVIVKPETVIAWHRAGFRLYWRWRSRRRSDRPKITQELRELILRLAQENSGAPKIHGELLKLGFKTPNERWLVICGEWGAVAIQRSGGGHFSRTTGK